MEATQIPVRPRWLNVIGSLILATSVVSGAEKTNDGHAPAIVNASQAIHRNPKNADAYCARAAAQLAKKRTNQAIADASRATTLAPEHAKAYLLRGQARFLRNQNVKALRDLSEAI